MWGGLADSWEGDSSGAVSRNIRRRKGGVGGRSDYLLEEGVVRKSLYLHVFKRDEVNVEEISIAAADAKNVTSYGQLQESWHILTTCIGVRESLEKKPGR